MSNWNLTVGSILDNVKEVGDKIKEGVKESYEEILKEQEKMRLEQQGHVENMPETQKQKEAGEKRDDSLREIKTKKGEINSEEGQVGAFLSSTSGSMDGEGSK